MIKITLKNYPSLSLVLHSLSSFLFSDKNILKLKILFIPPIFVPKNS